MDCGEEADDDPDRHQVRAHMLRIECDHRNERFESIVPSIVAASRFSVRRAAMIGGTRATLKKMSRHDSPNTADFPGAPERLRRRGGSIVRADSSRRGFERARGHPRAPPGTRCRDRGAEAP